MKNILNGIISKENVVPHSRITGTISNGSKSLYFYNLLSLRDLSEISRGEGGGNFKFGFGNEMTHPCNGSEIC